jgi:glyoxylase I family protein
MAFVVDDLQGLQTRLDVAGVPYTRSRSGRAALFCRDPDGNALEWIQREVL